MTLFGGRSRQRLKRELEAFETEWKAVKARPENQEPKDKPWVTPGDEYLDRVRKLLERGDTEGAWLNLNAARRQIVYGLSATELANRAQVLREESDKLSRWRSRAMLKVLDGAPLTPAKVAQAMEIRDEYFQNQYHKLVLVTDQFKVLLVLAALALALFAALWTSPLPDDADLLNPRLVGAILLMGLLGGTFSSAKALFTGAAKGTIPERMTESWVTLVRTLFGAAAGLAGYLLYESGILHITVGENGTATDLAIAFLFGYAGERLVSKIADAAGEGKG
jgi:hypothetical protein